MMQRVERGFEIKDVTATGSFAGYGSVYGNVDFGDDIVSAGAFGESLKSYEGTGRMPALLWQHKRDQPIGAYQKMREDDVGLYVEGKLAMKTQQGAEAHELLQMKAISGMSVGFMTRLADYDQKTGIRTIKQGDLMEVSIVTFPMNDAARITQSKQLMDEICDFKSAERFLRDAGGFSRSEALALVAKFKALVQREAVDPDETKHLLSVLQNRAQVYAP